MIKSMLFFPTKDFILSPKDYALEPEDVFFTTEDGIKLHGWFFGAKPGTVSLLFFHGNADNIASRLPKASEWVNRGVSVLLVDYRGYGKSKGSIEKGDDLYRDGEAALKWLKEKKGFNIANIVLYGESIGSIPAVEFATKEKFKAIILEAPFTSLKEIAKHHYGIVPDFLLKDFLLDNEVRMPKIKSPVFIVQGTEDEVVPPEMGKRLFTKAPEPKQFYQVKGGHHNDLPSVSGPDFTEKPFQFISR